jgi:hypothetical protein
MAKIFFLNIPLVVACTIKDLISWSTILSMSLAIKCSINLLVLILLASLSFYINTEETKKLKKVVIIGIMSVRIFMNSID